MHLNLSVVSPKHTQEVSQDAPIVFIGMRGAGKSFLSSVASKYTGLPLYSIDEMIQKRISSTISEFVDQCGWEEFRNVEMQCFEEAIDHGGLIL